MKDDHRQSETHDPQKSLTELFVSTQVMKAEVTALVSLVAELSRVLGVTALDGLDVMSFFVRERAAELESTLADFLHADPGFAAQIRKVLNRSKDDYPTL